MQLVNVSENEFFELFKRKKHYLTPNSKRTRDHRRRNVLESNYTDKHGTVQAQIVRDCRGKHFYVRKEWFNETC